MGADIEVNIDPVELQLLNQALKRLPMKMRHNLERKALRKSLASVRKKARQAAPVRTGRLRKSITSKVSLKRNIGLLSGKVFISSRLGVHYGHLVEWGSNKLRGHLFMTRVFEGEKDNIVRNFRTAIRSLLAKPKV